MPFNINEFIAVTSEKGVLKNNKFMMQFPTPQGLLGGPNSPSASRVNREMEMWCTTSNLPGAILESHAVRRYGVGVTQNRPFLPRFDKLRCEFLMDGAAENHTYFHLWRNMIVNSDRGQSINTPTSRVGNKTDIYPYEVAYRNDYVVDITLHVFDDRADIVQTYIFREAYPELIADIPLGWDRRNEVARFNVDFAFTDWYNKDVNSLGGFEPQERD